MGMPVQLYYTSQFKRDYKKLPEAIQALVKEKGALFQESPFHPLLKTHKLAGGSKRLWAFSIDPRIRVLFEFLGNGEVQLLRVGDRSLYRKVQ